MNDFLEDGILLEATMVRCGENRAERKYTPECVNAREAANRIAGREAEARREQLEAQSERKRQALRRAQEAAAEARRRAADAERLRREAELMGRLPAEDGAGELAEGEQAPQPPAGETAAPAGEASAPDAPPAGSAESAEAPPAAAGDLEAVREELRRRREQDEDRQN